MNGFKVCIPTRCARSVGPAAVDSPSAALEYAARLATLAREVQSDLLVVMRCELTTPITPSTGPWPGMLFDPEGDGSYQINSGIRKARSLLLQLAQLGLPTAHQFRDTITPQFFADLLSWANVSSASETLGDLVSGLSMPVGLRAPRQDSGATEDVAMTRAAVTSAGSARYFLGVTSHGLAGIVQSTGNEDTALLLDGGRGEPSARAASVLQACADSSGAVLAECAGGGPYGVGADGTEQASMATALAAAIADGVSAPIGLSISSYLLSGAQQTHGSSSRIHGLSTTDPCMDWIATEQLLRALAAAVRQRREKSTQQGGAKKRQRS